MRIPLQVVLIGLSIATATRILEGAKRVMSGKHKRSPKKGDSPLAKEAKVARDVEHSLVEENSHPTDKEVAAAEAARGRLNGDQASATSVRSYQRNFHAFACAQNRLQFQHAGPPADVRGQAARWARTSCCGGGVHHKQPTAATRVRHSR